MSSNRPILLITGASRGIGAATASLAASRGYQVAVNYRASQAEADGVVEAIRRDGGESQAFQADVSQASEAERLFAEVGAALGPVQALVNNVGGTGGIGPFGDNDAEKLQRVFALNTFSAFYCTRLAAPQMAAAGGGAIVNVTSQAAIFGGVNISAYAAAKAAVSTMTVSASKELAADGIRVNAVSPGVIEAGEFLDYPQDRREAMLANLPLGRFGEPAEVAESIVWLLSDQAAYVTGAILPVCGGR